MGSHFTSGSSVSRAVKRFAGGIAGALNLRSGRTNELIEAPAPQSGIRGLSEDFKRIDLGGGAKIFIAEPSEKAYFEDDEEYAPAIRQASPVSQESANLPASQKRSVRFEEPADLFVNAMRRPVYEDVDFEHYTVKQKPADEGTFGIEIEPAAPVVSVEDVKAEPAEAPEPVSFPGSAAAEDAEEMSVEVPEMTKDEMPAVMAEPLLAEAVEDVGEMSGEGESIEVPEMTKDEMPVVTAELSEAAEAADESVEVAEVSEEEEPVLETGPTEHSVRVLDLFEDGPVEEVREEPARSAEEEAVSDGIPLIAAPAEVLAISAPADKPIIEGLYTEGESEVSGSAAETDDVIGIGGSLLSREMAVTSGSGVVEQKMSQTEEAEVMDTTEPEPIFEIRNENRDYLMAFVPGLADEELELTTSECGEHSIPEDGMEEFDERLAHVSEVSVEVPGPAEVPVPADAEVSQETPSADGPVLLGSDVSSETVRETPVEVSCHNGIDKSVVADIIDGVFDE